MVIKIMGQEGWGGHKNVQNRNNIRAVFLTKNTSFMII